MGAGHDGAARTLAEQLRAGGHIADVKDFLDSAPLRLGAALRRGYELELRHVPSAYEATYRFWYRAPWLRPFLAWLVALVTRRRIMRWVEEIRPHVVVSTYPLSTLCLGRLRRTKRLGIPAVNFITDFGVHPLWVHPGADLNLAIHDLPAAEASRLAKRPAVACGPAVSPRFDPAGLPDRAEARARFGIPADSRAVLIVAGSWGVGDLASTWRAVARADGLVPVVVCGRDAKLRRRVEALAAGSPAVVIGWTDDMPALMAACDALVENAGGLTSLEAMAAGLPVVSFDPIAGHGRQNTAAMDEAGVARLAPDPAALVGALDVLTRDGAERRIQVARARDMFRRPPAELVLEAAAPAPLAGRRRRLPVPVRIAVAGTALAVVGWAGLTTGVAVATEAGAGVAHPKKGLGPVAYLGVRLSAAELEDPQIDTELRQLDATVVVDGETAGAASEAIRSLLSDGLTVAGGGPGSTDADGQAHLPWQEAERDARADQEISEVLDTPVRQSVPGRPLTLWDLVDSDDDHTSLVVPNHILRIASWSGGTIVLRTRDIYLVTGMGATARQTALFLASLRSSFASSQLLSEPLASLA